MSAPGFKAEKILAAVLEGIAARETENISIDDFLDRRFHDDNDGRAVVTNLLFTYYRQKAGLDRLLKELAPAAKNKFKSLLQSVMTQLYFMDGIAAQSAVNVAVDCAKKQFGQHPAGFINAVLRRAATIDFPSWLSQQRPLDLLPGSPELKNAWKSQLPPQELERLGEILRQQPPFTFRLRKDIPETELSEACATPLPLPEWSGQTRFYQSSKPGAVLKSGWLEQGAIYVQDPATALAPNLPDRIPDGALILDLCAAPGGKSLMLAERVKNGNLIAADISWRRQQLTRENFHNASYQHPVIVASASHPPFRPASFDVILLDVPCSNSGVGRHRPDALWAYTAQKTRELAAIQAEILNRAAPLLKQGGQLIYSTCSIEKQEDEAQVCKFLADHPGFSLEKQIKILPFPHHDGAFAALLRRNQ